MQKREKRYCNACQRSVETIERELTEGPHYSSHTCAVCGKHCGFGKKPGNEDKRGKNKYSPEDLKIPYCQICLRSKTRLGDRGVLHSHHVIEINDGGEDIPGNIHVLCTSCHTLVHHQRTYLNRHLKCLYGLKDLQKDMDRFRVPKESQEIMRRIFSKGGGDAGNNS